MGLNGALRGVLASFGVEVDTSAIERANPKIEAFTGFLGSVADRLKQGFGFKDLGVTGLVADLQGQAGGIGKAARTAGVGTNEIQRLMYQTGKGADDLSRVFRVLTRNMSLATAKQGAENLNEIDDVMGGELPGSGKKATQLFKSLGISIDEVDKASPAELFTNMAEKIGQIGSVADRNRAAVLAFGPDGPSLIKDTEALRALGEEYDKIGGFTEEDIARFKGLGKAQKENDLAWNKLRILLGSTFVPILTSLTRAGSAVYKWVIDTTKGTNTFTVAAGFVVAALVAMNAESALVLGKWALMALPWLALFLVVEDLFTFLSGGDSVIGSLLDTLGQAIGIGDLGKEAQADFKALYDFISTHSPSELWAQFSEDMVRIWKFGFGQTWADFVSWEERLDDAIDQWAIGLAKSAGSAASNFITGLIDGISNGTAAVLDRIKELGKDIGGTFRNVLGIRSPSTVAEDAMVNFDRGGAEGLSGGLTVAAVADTAHTVSEAFAPRSAVRGGGGDTTIDARQTISLQQSFTGMRDERSVREAARDGAADVFNDANRELLAALETVAP